ncbi:MAG TPA: DUF763 domain-containing protein, partial [Vicinamibacterales bacterium]|nr:DUF763 domain-containing protein [Vicinamibacterales bacterium]
MRSALGVTILLLASSLAADAQTSVTLDQVFADYCTAQPSANPACDTDSSATSAYKWLLLDDVCAHGDRHPYCSRFASISHATEPCVLAYSHRGGRWRPLHVLGSEKWAYDTDVNGVPTIVVSKTGECTAIVEETKPLTYGVELGAVEEKENDLFAGLKDLDGLLGATLGAAAEHSVAARTPSVRSDSVDELATATSSLARSLVALADLRADVVAALNAAELSDTGELTPVDWGSAVLDAALWHDQFAWLRRRRQQAIDSLDGTAPTREEQKILDQAQKVLDRREDIAKPVAALAATRDRWNQFVVGSRMMTWMVVNLREQPVSWTKDQVHEFRIGVETPFASDVATRLPKVETSLRFTSPKASMFGIGAGLVRRWRQAHHRHRARLAHGAARALLRLAADPGVASCGQHLGHPTSARGWRRDRYEDAGVLSWRIARDHEVDSGLRRPHLAERQGARWPAGARPGGQRRCDQAEGYFRRRQLRERQLRHRRPAALHEVTTACDNTSMKRSGVADLPLHGGRVPAWLASRMEALGTAIAESVIVHYGRPALLSRLSDPFWFQALGTVMGMDWHSSGITTSVMGALKKGLNPRAHEFGVYICGGRGRHSRNTPAELTAIGQRTGLDAQALVRTSRLTARIDNNAIADGFQIYLHTFVLTR